MWIVKSLLPETNSEELNRDSLKAAVAESWFYSDSQNDAALLQLVDHPVAVDPDPSLQRLAQEKGWEIMSLRNDEA